MQQALTRDSHEARGMAVRQDDIQQSPVQLADSLYGCLLDLP